MNATTSTNSSRLIFQSLINAAGFTNPHIQEKSQSDLEIVVRELLQNSHDERADRVNMRIVTIPVGDMPGVAEYKSAFESACEIRKDKLAASRVEALIASRIRDILDSESVTVLLCADNGKGIAQANMQSLLWPGNTNKGTDTGTGGSFGVGHCAAFKVSDLRYVLYATRTTGGVELEAGSAFIAQHKTDDSTRSPEGFYVADLLDSDDSEKAAYSRPSGQMARWLAEFAAEGLIPAGATGTVVAIFGFRAEQDAVSKICEAATKNFL